VQASDEDCEGLANYALAIKGIEVALFFREQPDGIFRVSLRSKGAVNVRPVAQALAVVVMSAPAAVRWRARWRQRPSALLEQLRTSGYRTHVQ